MQRIALGVEYDGSGFAGWQAQRGRRTVAAELGEWLGPVRVSQKFRTPLERELTA